MNANEVIKQLGGNRFIAMTGSKNFIHDSKNSSMSFKIGKNSKCVTHVRIKLVNDLYDIEYLSIRGTQPIKTKAFSDGVYAENICEDFERNTGLYTSF